MILVTFKVTVPPLFITTTVHDHRDHTVVYEIKRIPVDSDSEKGARCRRQEKRPRSAIVFPNRFYVVRVFIIIKSKEF